MVEEFKNPGIPFAIVTHGNNLLMESDREYNEIFLNKKRLWTDEDMIHFADYCASGDAIILLEGYKKLIDAKDH